MASLSALIERTYSSTLDCSRLDEARSMEHVLTGYRRTGVYRPEWWIIAGYRGHDVGCVLLADHPEHDQCELMYLGVVPEWRGHGWGRELASYAQWLARRAGRERIVLAVDDANWPARQIYDGLGFQLWDRRSVYVRTARSNGPPAPSLDS
jgi:ribosomal protein S18 acetylase RimI-like enzyme